MKKKDRFFIMYLDDIILSMGRIFEYTHGFTFEKFKEDYKTVDAVIRNFEIIGEASKNLPKDFKNLHKDIPWDEMYLLRNRVSHEYFGIDYDIIWDITIHHLPENKINLEKIRENLI